MTQPQMPPDVEAQEEMIDHLRKLRREGWVIDRLAEPPTHVAGCDDPNGRFAWYVMSNPKDELVVKGYFHLPHGVDL